MKHVVTVVLRVVIFHVEKSNGQEHNVPTPKIDTLALHVMGRPTHSGYRRLPSIILDARLLRDADCDSYKVSKQHRRLMWRSLISRS
jgi:hypothetical protein